MRELNSRDERILLVEDEEPIRDLVQTALRFTGFTVESAGSGAEGLAMARNGAWDLLILDVNLPEIDGFTLCRKLRDAGDNVPVIFLTARDDPADLRAGFTGGADDYLTKPFSARELVARIHVMLRRPRTTADETSQQVRVFGDLRIDPEAREVTLADQPVSLTRTEFDILDVLSAHPRRVHSRAVLVEEVWGQGWVGDERIVDVHVAHLRAKLGDASSEPAYIRTVRGVGFRMGDG